MTNRHYTIGYSYYFRQAKWALEIVDPDLMDIERADNFRPDYRVPEIFRADLADYRNSDFDRGHLVASANQRETDLQNSETFLLSNMSPQLPQFNRKIWKKLEEEVRRLDRKPSISETYVICGPIFDFDKATTAIGAEDNNGVSLPIPHAYFKSILTENTRGTLHMWSFILPNKGTRQTIDSFLVPTTQVERYAGIKLWERLEGSKVQREKSRVRRMW
ncbi:MAG: DNA/RNA endonuclease G [Pseudomonadales bacterium]|nr:DNA/RNA endonuclease G [Pseudomonadales bacterium]